MLLVCLPRSDVPKLEEPAWPFVQSRHPAATVILHSTTTVRKRPPRKRIWPAELANREDASAVSHAQHLQNRCSLSALSQELLSRTSEVAEPSGEDSTEDRRASDSPRSESSGESDHLWSSLIQSLRKVLPEFLAACLLQEQSMFPRSVRQRCDALREAGFPPAQWFPTGPERHSTLSAS